MKILADAALPYLSELFSSPFELTLYHKQADIPDLLPTHEILLCRSTLKVTSELLALSDVQCVATASSGIDHIDSSYLLKHGIRLLDAKGCNARAVADYVVASLAYLFKTERIIGNKAGIIGVGEVGSCVVDRLKSAGFSIHCYDPWREKKEKNNTYCSWVELSTCDLLCLHANLHESPPFPSANLLTTPFLSQLKPGTVIINAARGGIMNETALLKTTQPLTYCTDVYSGEPDIHAEIIHFATLCTPHIAGHSIEAKRNAILKISQKLHHLYNVPK